MSSIRFGGGISDARGSHGGLVLSRNKSGAIGMVRTKGCNPSTPNQSLFRTMMPRMSNAWNYTLSDAQRAAWRAFASTYPVINRIGNTTTLSGPQIFAKLNGLIVKQGFTLQASPPASTVISNPTAFAIDAQATAVAHLKVTCSVAAVGANEIAALFLSPPMSPGRGYISSQLRFMGFVTLNFAGANVASNYNAIFGQFPSAPGQRIFGRFYVINTTTGIPSAAIQANTLWV